jgi:hypothetical protein
MVAGVNEGELLYLYQGIFSLTKPSDSLSSLISVLD